MSETSSSVRRAGAVRRERRRRRNRVDAAAGSAVAAAGANEGQRAQCGEDGTLCKLATSRGVWHRRRSPLTVLAASAMAVSANLGAVAPAPCCSLSQRSRICLL